MDLFSRYFFAHFKIWAEELPYLIVLLQANDTDGVVFKEPFRARFNMDIRFAMLKIAFDRFLQANT